MVGYETMKHPRHHLDDDDAHAISKLHIRAEPKRIDDDELRWQD